LRKAGFKKVLNLKGGVLAWSDEVDSSVPKYWNADDEYSNFGFAWRSAAA